MFVKTAPGRRAPAIPMQPVVDPAGWTAADLAKTDSWIYTLSDSEISNWPTRPPACRTEGRT